MTVNYNQMNLNYNDNDNEALEMFQGDLPSGGNRWAEFTEQVSLIDSS